MIAKIKKEYFLEFFNHFLNEKTLFCSVRIFETYICLITLNKKNDYDVSS